MEATRPEQGNIVQSRGKRRSMYGCPVSSSTRRKPCTGQCTRHQVHAVYHQVGFIDAFLMGQMGLCQVVTSLKAKALRELRQFSGGAPIHRQNQFDLIHGNTFRSMSKIAEYLITGGSLDLNPSAADRTNLE